MSKTKLKILKNSLELFNEKGVYNCTLRMIATESGMSQGNLTYHFKNKKEIIELLYFELVEKVDAEMLKLIHMPSVLSLMYHSAGNSMKIFFEYRFLMSDLYLIFKENEKIRMHYMGLQQVRSQQFLMFIQALVEQELFRPAIIENEYARFYERMNILSDNWINAQEILYNTMEAPVDYYKDLLFEVIFPYLTEKGRVEFKEITSKKSR
jgi:AcrR family transcriptional regulator